MIPRELADLCERAPGFTADELRLIGATLRSQADEIDALKAAAIVAGNLKLDEWAKLETQLCSRAQQVKNLMVEVDRLKDVVRHAEYWEAVRTEERDAAVKVANEREAIKAAWLRITGSQGWLSCAYFHDCRCPKSLPKTCDLTCACGADDFRRLMEEE